MSASVDGGPLDPDAKHLLELIAHALRLQLSYLSRDQALAVADTILRTFKAEIIAPAAQIIPAARGSVVMNSPLS